MLIAPVLASVQIMMSVKGKEKQIYPPLPKTASLSVSHAPTLIFANSINITQQ